MAAKGTVFLAPIAGVYLLYTIKLSSILCHQVVCQNKLKQGGRLLESFRSHAQATEIRHFEGQF